MNGVVWAVASTKDQPDREVQGAELAPWARCCRLSVVDRVGGANPGSCLQPILRWPGDEIRLTRVNFALPG